VEYAATIADLDAGLRIGTVGFGAHELPTTSSPRQRVAGVTPSTRSHRRRMAFVLALGTRRRRSGVIRPPSRSDGRGAL
jgi:hypothetical protein